MYIYVYICIRIHIHTLYIYTYVYIYILDTYVYIYLYTCIYICTATIQSTTRNHHQYISRRSAEMVSMVPPGKRAPSGGHQGHGDPLVIDDIIYIYI